MSESGTGPGEEVQSEDAGVPNDPPGPDVPEESGGSEAPDVPGHPTEDQPEGVQEGDGSDDESSEGIAQVGDVEGADSASQADDDSGSDSSEEDGAGQGAGEGPSDIGAPTKPAEPAS